MRHSSMTLATLIVIGSMLPFAVAEAADAVVAVDPEPDDSVKICEAYGSGYFYIPGTATCLRLSGLVRYQTTLAGYSPDLSGVDRSKTTLTQAELNFYVRNDSEYGMVYSWVEWQRVDRLRHQRVLDTAGTGHDWETVEFGANNVKALFGVGAFEFGYNDSQYAVFFGNGGLTDLAGQFINTTYKVRHQASYTLYADYLTAIVSLENRKGSDEDLPDVVGGVRYDFGDVNASAGLAYDQYDDSVAFIGRVDAEFGRYSMVLEGLGATSASNSFFAYDGISVLAGLSSKVTEKVTLATDIQLWDNNDWLGIADVNYVMAPGFQILLEGAVGDMAGVKRKSGMLRFERFF